MSISLGYLPHSFQGSFFSGNHQTPSRNRRFLKRTMVKQNGEATPRMSVVLSRPQISKPASADPINRNTLFTPALERSWMEVATIQCDARLRGALSPGKRVGGCHQLPGWPNTRNEGRGMRRICTRSQEPFEGALGN